MLNGNSVLKMQSKRIDVVVDQQYILQCHFASRENLKVFYLKITALKIVQIARMLVVVPMLEVLTLWINVVEDGVGLVHASSSEKPHFEMLVGVFKALNEVRPHGQFDVSVLLVTGIQNANLNFWLEIVGIVKRFWLHDMDESLI